MANQLKSRCCLMQYKIDKLYIKGNGMVLIVKKFVKVFPKNAAVPVQYKNLRKNKHVRTFSRPFLNIPEILVQDYGLKWEEKIIVFHMKEIENCKGWRYYRTPFKKVYYGTVREFGDYL